MENSHMLDRTKKEKQLISEGSNLMKLQIELNLLKRKRNDKTNELKELNSDIKDLVALITKKGGKASVT